MERRVRLLERERGRHEATDGILFLADASADPAAATALVAHTGAIVPLDEFEAAYPRGTWSNVIIGVDPHRI